MGGGCLCLVKAIGLIWVSFASESDSQQSVLLRREGPSESAVSWCYLELFSSCVNASLCSMKFSPPLEHPSVLPPCKSPFLNILFLLSLCILWLKKFPSNREGFNSRGNCYTTQGRHCVFLE